MRSREWGARLAWGGAPVLRGKGGWSDGDGVVEGGLMDLGRGSTVVVLGAGAASRDLDAGVRIVAQQRHNDARSHDESEDADADREHGEPPRMPSLFGSTDEGM